MRAHEEKLLKSDEDKLSRRGETIYYFGTLFFVAGIILIGFATASIMFFQINTLSEAKLVADTVTYMGVGLLLVTLGINFMLRQSKKGYLIFSLGTVFAIVGIVTFYLNFETNWYYPTISYILLAYLLGFLLLMGNAFGQVTLWILRKSQETESAVKTSKKQQREYTDEEIQRDIDQAIKKTLKQAADRLQFNLSTGPTFRVSSGSANTETIIKRKDTMNEAMVLQQTLNPGAKEEWGGAGIDKASMLLSDTLNTDSTHKKKITNIFHNFFHKN